MNSIEFDKIIKLNSVSRKRLRLNGDIICEFVLPSHIREWQTYDYFTEQYKEYNCQRLSQYADVIVHELGSNDCVPGRLFYNIDLDLSCYHTLVLCIYANN